MKFMMIVKSAERSGRPPQALMEAIDKLGQEAVKAGTMVASGGLAPTAVSTRVRLSGGQLTKVDGPFTEAKEVIGGHCVFLLQEKGEAPVRGSRFLGLAKKNWPGGGGGTGVCVELVPDAV